MPKPKTVYALIQQGGSSHEMYLHVYDSRAEAMAGARGHRSASYEASEVFEIPGTVANEETYQAIEAALRAAMSLL